MSFEIIVTQTYTSLVRLNLTSEMELLYEGDARVVVRALNGREQHRLVTPASEWTILSKNLTLLSDKVDLLAVGKRESNERIIVLRLDLNNLVNCIAISAVSAAADEDGPTFSGDVGVAGNNTSVIDGKHTDKGDSLVGIGADTSVALVIVFDVDLEGSDAPLLVVIADTSVKFDGHVALSEVNSEIGIGNAICLSKLKRRF
jgi:hypothetical protein